MTSRSDPSVVLAVDIGGTKIDAAVVDGAGTLLSSARVPTPAYESAEVVLDAVLAAAREALATHQPAGCGVGVCGSTTPVGTVSTLNIPAWTDFPLAEQLQPALDLAVTVENDAKALALGEQWLGAAQGVENYLAMVVSTGVGGGIVLDNRLLGGRTGSAGRIGHICVEPGGRLCPCGARGCLEAEAAGPAIAAITGRDPATAPPEVVARTGHLVGRAIASVADLLDLDLALVGGSVALGYGQPFFDAASATVAELCQLRSTRGTSVAPVGLGLHAPLLGAAAVARAAEAENSFG